MKQLTKKRVEYQISGVDEFGDLVDTDHRDTKKEAIQVAKNWLALGEYPTIIVEKLVHTIEGREDWPVDQYELKNTDHSDIFGTGDKSIYPYGEWTGDWETV